VKVLLVAARFAALLASGAALLGSDAAGGGAAAQIDLTLSIDYQPAERLLDLLDGEPEDTRSLARLPGTLVAAATTGLMAERGGLESRLHSSLDSLRDRAILRDDVFLLEAARTRREEIASMLDTLRRSNFSRRVVATVMQIFPPDASMNATVPVHVVALGHENADAYVRRVVWENGSPRFTGEGEGEATIVINLSAAARMGGPPEERLTNILITVAHEVFHVAFGMYQSTSPAWTDFREQYAGPADFLMELVQNEGIAYYLSLEQRVGERVPRDWYARMAESFEEFGDGSLRLLAGDVSYAEAADIIRRANLSGYFESFGSMTGMCMAREIDRNLGRAALIETIRDGPLAFVSKYIEASAADPLLPQFPDHMAAHYGLQ
jgi:hypothetical protein